LAKTLSELPFDLLFGIVYAIPAYWMIQLDPDLKAFGKFLVIIDLSIYTSRSIALAVAAGITNFQQASFVGNITYTVDLLS